MNKVTTSDFIQKAILIHDYKYSYEKTEYLNSKTKATITCKTHGDFKQTPSNHLSGFNCAKCAKEEANKKLLYKSKTLFETRARKVHFDRYGYDKVVYLSSNKKVLITCKKHGNFLQTPSNHLRGQGCPTCANNQKFTSEIIINKANIVHNEYYNYDKLVYENIDKKVIITCPKHGDFLQTPYSHLKGNGCSKCSRKIKKTTPVFIDESNLKHNYKYDYPRLIYKNLNEKVIITCRVHGDFEQIAINHLKGHGCPKCVKGKTKLNSEIIELANLVHNNKYLYPDLNYLNAKTKVKIKCKLHGDFEQLPFNHLKGSGCPKCKMSKGEKQIAEILKKLNIPFESQYKFDGCVFKNKLYFDFAIFIDGKIGLIEFQGIQHYKDIVFFNKKNNFLSTQKKDAIKLNYAKKKNINLLLIPYYEIENIEKIICTFINENFKS